jgi:hypothetical protein
MMVAYGARAGDDTELDPFIITSRKPLELRLLIEANLVESPDGSDAALLNAIENKTAIMPPVSSRTRKYHNKRVEFVNFTKRFCVAILGGVALVGPMLLMILYKHRLTSLLTVSVSVFVFGIVMAAILEKPEAVLATVAAYAAVLVVFVGTSS